VSEPERLQKVLARAGVGSRRAVETMIEAGRLKINGKVARLGQRVDPAKDKVELDGSSIPLNTDLIHYLLHKPEGVVTTADDPDDRPTVLEVVDLERRVWPVGRLDVDTEGALLLTNDGELTQALTHPSFKVPKTYLADLKGSVGNRALRQLAKGVLLDDGPTQPAAVRIVERVAGGTLVEITLTEGRNRQVRRMGEAVGHPVRRLVRVSIGPIGLGRLKPGRFRRLSPEEVMSLYRAAGL
jgi:23S rRNA pseudouridine2605 synthase